MNGEVIRTGTVVRVIPSARHNITGESGKIYRVARITEGNGLTTCWCNPWSRSTRRRNRAGKRIGEPEGFTRSIETLFGPDELEPYNGSIPTQNHEHPRRPRS
jgi:hypothetical protein